MERTPRHSIETLSSGLGIFFSDAEDERDPYGNFYFVLELDGVEVAHFLEASGLKNACQPFEIIEGGLNSRVHKLPAQSKWDNLTLKYGTSSKTELLEWRDKFLQDDFTARLNGSISMKNNHGDTMRRFNFTNAWPVSWEGPSFSSEGSALAIESLEIAHEGLTVESGSASSPLDDAIVVINEASEAATDAVDDLF
jgi:phage tail-like protein